MKYWCQNWGTPVDIPRASVGGAWRPLERNSNNKGFPACFQQSGKWWAQSSQSTGISTLYNHHHSVQRSSLLLTKSWERVTTDIFKYEAERLSLYLQYTQCTLHSEAISTIKHQDKEIGEGATVYWVHCGNVEGFVRWPAEFGRWPRPGQLGVPSIQVEAQTSCCWHTASLTSNYTHAATHISGVWYF